MGTQAYDFRNRCIVVSAQDLEDGQHPKTKRQIELSSGRPLGSYELDVSRYEEELGKLEWHKIVMTYSDYEGACIDFVLVSPRASDDNGKEQLTTTRNVPDWESWIVGNERQEYAQDKALAHKIVSAIRKDYEYDEFIPYITDNHWVLQRVEVNGVPIEVEGEYAL